MILSYYHVSVDPPAVAAAFEADGNRVCGNGTGWGAFLTESSSILKNNEMIGEQLNFGDHEKILDYLKNKEPILISVGPSTFTTGGHFMVLTGINADGTLSLNDPNGPDTSVTQDYLFSILKGAWYIHPKA